MKFALFTFLTLSLAAFVSAVPTLTQALGRRWGLDSFDTNAKRLAAGLGPLAPRKVWSTTPDAKRWAPVEHVGKLKVCKWEDDHWVTVGFVAKTLTASGGYSVHSDPNQAATISFRAPDDRPTFKHSFTDQSSKSDPNRALTGFFGLAIPRGQNLTTSMNGSGNKRAGSTQTDHATAVGSGQTAQNAPPQQVASTATASSFIVLAADAFAGADAESATWDFDPVTKKITCTFTNYDKTVIKPTFFLRQGVPAKNVDAAESASSIDLVSDPQSYQSNNPGATAVAVSFD